MNNVRLPSGEAVAALGQGTWRMGDQSGTRAEEIATLQMGIDLGLSLIDTAEMYGEGKAEALVGDAIAGRRDQVFVVSKVYPHNASRKAMRTACGNSLKRLRTECIDLYLLHWRGNVPPAETLEAMQALQRDGLIRHYGVSNLDLDDMKEWWSLPGGKGVQVNQVLYNLSRRGIEFDLLPWLRGNGVPVMAYSPMEQGRLLRHTGLADVARRHGMTASQAALSWLLAKEDVIAIPKTGNRLRLKENADALRHPLNPQALAELDLLFAPPRAPQPLEMI